MAASQKTDKAAQCPKTQKVHKRLLDNGADAMSFRNTFGKQPKTVFPPSPSPTDAHAQDQQTGSSHRYSNPQDSAQTSGSPVSPGLGQAAQTNQYSGQEAGTHPSSGYYPFQSGHAGPAPSGTATLGQASPAYPPSSSVYNPYGAHSVFAPHNTETHFSAASTYGATQQIIPQGQPPQRPWDHAGSQPVWQGMGTTGYSQFMGAQQNGPVENQFLGHHLYQMQQGRQQHPCFQSPPTYHPNHVDPSAVDESHYLPASNSPESGPNGTPN